MKKIKQLCILLCALTLIFSNGIAAGAEDTTVTLYGFSFTINSDGYAVIHAYDDRSASVSIPNKLLEAPVIEIADNAFWGHGKITSVSFDNARSLKRIGENAFAGCDALSAVTIPDSVKELGFGAFQKCTSLAKIEIGSGISTIPAQCFYNCTALTTVTLSDSVTVIADYAFSGCTGLDTVTIPATVTTIGEGAFDGCSWLTIYGTAGSEAERYANANGIPFIDTETLHDTPLIRGDANCDGDVTILDATCIQRRLAQLNTARYNALAADADGDGMVIIRDATRIQRWLADFTVPGSIGQPIT